MNAQRIRFPETPPSVGQPGATPLIQPGATFGNPGFPQGVPGATLGPPTFDPFAAGGQPIPPGSLPPGAYATPQPYGAYPGPGPAGMGGPGFNQQPQGIFGGNPNYSGTPDWLSQFEQGRYLRVIQEVHFRHTWLEGGSGAEVDIHDSEVGFTLNWPNFVGSGEPLQISPVFILHQWDGPQAPGIGLADLPSRAYSAFLASSWSSPTGRNFGGEVVSSVGVYTDFDTFTSRSLRVKGKGLGWVRLTPNMTLKFGIEYLNRLDVKLFPAGGLFWKFSDRVDLELYFPSPKIKYKLPQLGNTELVGYLTAGYGGDALTVRRAAGFSDQVDVIDIRALAGVEFVNFIGFRGFFEAGYAFDRELIYRVFPSHSLKLNSSAIVRAGFLF